MDLQRKLNRVLNSASSLFIVPGFSETKMQDIAKGANLAVGTLYSMFKSKDDLLNFIFAATLNSDFINGIRSLPLKIDPENQLLIDTKAVYKAVYKAETKNMALILNQTDNDAAFEEMINYLFKTFNRYGAYFLILERNPQMNPQLLTLYRKYRKELYQNIATFLADLQVHNKIRRLKNPEYDSIIIIDQIFWWSAHKRFDSFDRKNSDLDLLQFQTIVTDHLVKGFEP
ncbi:helix-turn-helix domain-containing protein [Lactiplantibacillus plantarum]|uniref:TetR/AcrR family transcriptional regulator n=1 Tax=Lactiplantibacillus plantarum TaxID=1590 RepID=UPI001ABF3575|nr:helix-turn-helix domain-containing protein [Lactiplantibacillus plantarum]MCC9315518.1 helix-turn-helix transcriptional regulator [Lactiplantibacillus plantarum]MDF3265766.1 helix-turn-helix domain containing protein [Lactiplantibacillus plantarum]MDO1603510.1 helix-turn-helix domain-containing protein [Lactiplantibacillus plantarum]MEE4616244.1 helix-turn-helix domain-containing protein [Lactiplantibacillus plantarum]